jgi:hypothetical protein
MRQYLVLLLALSGCIKNFTTNLPTDCDEEWPDFSAPSPAVQHATYFVPPIHKYSLGIGKPSGGSDPLAGGTFTISGAGSAESFTATETGGDNFAFKSAALVNWCMSTDCSRFFEFDSNDDSFSFNTTVKTNGHFQFGSSSAANFYSSMSAATASTTVAPFTFAPLLTLDVNDLLLNVKTKFDGSSVFRVDLEGDTTVAGQVNMVATKKICFDGAANCFGFISGDSNGILTLQGIALLRPGNASLATCAVGIEGKLSRDSTSGVATGKRTKYCLCTSDGSSNYAWQNIATGAVGNATTCGTE